MSGFRFGMFPTAIVMAIAAFSTAAGQETVQRVRDLYASAAYEDALGVLGKLHPGDLKPEVEQYRIYCLFALGRLDEAEQAIETIVTAHPTYVPNPADASPRIHELFTKTRQRLLPQMARQHYASARAALEQKDKALAVDRFQELLRLIDSADPAASPTLAEMRVLASGFLDLSRALPDPQAAEPVPAVLPVPALPEPVTFNVTPPVPINQELPAWTPVDTASRQGEFRGAVRVVISTAGTVESAELSPPIHPAYDQVLLEAARQWQYEPARQNGQPVRSEKLIEIVLKPR